MIAVSDADHRKKMNKLDERKATADAASAEMDVELKRVQVWKAKADLMREMGFDQAFITKALADAMREVAVVSELVFEEKLRIVADEV